MIALLAVNGLVSFAPSGAAVAIVGCFLAFQRHDRTCRAKEEAEYRREHLRVMKDLGKIINENTIQNTETTIVMKEVVRALRRLDAKGKE